MRKISIKRQRNKLLRLLSDTRCSECKKSFDQPTIYCLNTDHDNAYRFICAFAEETEWYYIGDYKSISINKEGA